MEALAHTGDPADHPLPEFTDALQQDFASRSLHEITTEYGEMGLRARFYYEVETSGYAPEDVERIYGALGLALHVHDGQMRGDLPYSTHFLRVATRIMSHYQVRSDPELTIAALLHDAVEDSPERITLPRDREYIGIDDLREAAFVSLAQRFSPRVSALVRAVTNPILASSVSEPERHALYREHVKQAVSHEDPGVAILKLSDYADNHGGLKHDPHTSHRTRRARKYASLEQFMIDTAQQVPLAEEVRADIVAGIQRGRERNQAFLRLDDESLEDDTPPVQQRRRISLLGRFSVGPAE